MLLQADRSLLLIVDVQERLAPVMEDPRRVIYGCARLIRGAQRLGVPVLVSEQNPRGIGPTVADVKNLVPPDSILTKMHFSCAHDEAIRERVAQSGRRQIVIAGIESHVCVLQTALGFLEQGYEVFVVEDCCSSRKHESLALAMDRARNNGIEVANGEMVLFEWLNVAGTPAFKDLIALIK